MPDEVTVSYYAIFLSLSMECMHICEDKNNFFYGSEIIIRYSVEIIIGSDTHAIPNHKDKNSSSFLE